MQRVQISNLCEISGERTSLVVFDVALSGHLIATVSVPCKGGRIIWSAASIDGFADFSPSELDFMSQQIRNGWDLRLQQARIQ
jgi:hypothetical protein